MPVELTPGGIIGSETRENVRRQAFIWLKYPKFYPAIFMGSGGAGVQGCRGDIFLLISSAPLLLKLLCRRRSPLLLKLLCPSSPPLPYTDGGPRPYTLRA